MVSGVVRDMTALVSVLYVDTLMCPACVPNLIVCKCTHVVIQDKPPCSTGCFTRCHMFLLWQCIVQCACY